MRSLGVAALVGLAACGSGDEVTGRSRDAIVGGQLELGRAYPIALRFEYPNAPGTFELRCSASLVGRRTVLTAGHCVVSDTLPPPTEAAFGVDAHAPDVVISVASWVVHPGYDPDVTPVASDIAVVELAEDAPVQPVGLLRVPLSTEAHVGPAVTFVGYGDTFSGAGDFGQRRVMTASIAELGPSAGPPPVHETAWIWFDRAAAEATCNGDSGGPGFFVDGAVEKQVGVHSASNCVNLGIDSRTDQVMLDAFVQAQLDAFEGLDPCRGDGVCEASCQTGDQLVDPDCAAAHCEADGICARACVMPVDPDCAWGTDLCQPGDGACNLDCPVLDEDCMPLCRAEGRCIEGCLPPDPDCGGGGTGGGDDGAGGEGGAETGGGVPQAEPRDDEGCGCAIPGDGSSSRGPLVAVGLALLALGLRGGSRRSRARRARARHRA
ncbi:MAG: S1 family peptidase [Polyangiaceae bacterium]